MSDATTTDQTFSSAPLNAGSGATIRPEEAAHFGAKVLPQIKTCSLPHAYGRVPASTPATPLGTGGRN